MPDELKPCPFCGGKAKIEEYAIGHKGNGTFTALYKCGCDKCKIYFAHNSEFTLEHGQPKFICNGYETVKEMWNRRADNG